MNEPEITDEMVERAAKAIPFIKPWDKQDDTQRAAQLKIARYVLEAALKP